LLAFCFNRESGELLWKKNAGSGYRPGKGDGFDYQLDSRSNYASPSPVTDGQRVIFFFGNGDLVSYLMDGSEEWRRNIQKDYGDFCFQWTFSSTPTLYMEVNSISPFCKEINRHMDEEMHPQSLICFV
jgi:outer membrane protein assembly factor BamB